MFVKPRRSPGQQHATTDECLPITRGPLCAMPRHRAQSSRCPLCVSQLSKAVTRTTRCLYKDVSTPAEANTQNQCRTQSLQSWRRSADVCRSGVERWHRVWYGQPVDYRRTQLDRRFSHGGWLLQRRPAVTRPRSESWVRANFVCQFPAFLVDNNQNTHILWPLLFNDCLTRVYDKLTCTVSTSGTSSRTLCNHVVDIHSTVSCYKWVD